MTGSKDTLKVITAIVCAASLWATGAVGAAEKAEKSGGGAITPNLDEGTKELRGSGRLDNDTPLGTDIELELGYGWFIDDNLEVLVLGSIADNDAVTTYSAGGGVEMSFPTDLVDGRVVPHVGAGALWAGAEADDDFGGESTDTVVGRVSAGSKYFVTENVALALDVVYNVAADDLYIDEDGEAQDDNLSVLFSIRQYFD